MRTDFRHRGIAVGLAILIVTMAAVASAQYSIPWHTIDGGGGTSTGGTYRVTGTIGQPDAGGPSIGGNHSVQGGFWSLITLIHTPGAPALSIFQTTTNTAIVYWPSPSTGFLLQQNTNLQTTNWIAPSETVNDNGTNRFIIINPPTSMRFYRLFKP